MTNVVTFYSYKGGVGRTMALVNVAHVLAREGLRVLMVDLDLEAPGMTHYFADRVREQATLASKDALDLLLDAKRTLSELEAERRKFKKVSLEEYVIHIPLPEAWLRTEPSGSPYENGRLDLLPATLEPTLTPEPSRDYLERMDELDLPGIFSAEGPRHRLGDHLRRYFTQARFRAPGDILRTMREEVWAAYDMVLVDSRTGLNEISGLCIGPLSDSLVVCTGLNQQNVEGTRYFMEKARLLDRERAKRFALVVGPVPPWHERVARGRAAEIVTILGAEHARMIPYHPSAALAEEVFVRDDPAEEISIAYANLASDLRQQASAEGPQLNVLWEGIENAFTLGAWEQYYHECARSLPLARVMGGWESEATTPIQPPFQQFATAATMLAFKSPSAFHREEWEEVGRSIAIAAGISALHRRSDAPFERAWALVGHLKSGDAQTDLGTHLTFMQLRVLGTLSRNASAWASATDAAEDHERSGLSTRVESWNRRVVGVYAAELGVLPADHVHLNGRTLGDDYELWAADLSMLSDLGAPKLGHAVESTINQILRLPDMAWLRADFSARLEGIRSHLLRMLGEVEGAELLDLGKGVVLDRRLPDLVRHYNRELRRGRLVGTWPLPLMLSVVSLVKGPEASEEILAWVNLCRIFHGYAWRVLVDWRHLKEVRRHPRFAAFMQRDDEETEKIEAAIDRGRYPL
jgi:MinD-like ATPase involved in chromosome partitioning or flagellar assembly